jgi:outer membrane protein OmpA-like peptidoglycan-associated protein
MHHLYRGLVILTLASRVGFALAQDDQPGSRDYPGITRMPNFYIYQFSDVQFDSVNFPVTQNGRKAEQTIEGHTIRFEYVQKDGTPAFSMVQIVRNLQNAARNVGGQVLDDSRGDNWYNSTLRLNRDGKEVWVLIESRSDKYSQTVLEREAMKQDVVMNADQMAGGLESAGSVALYGIYFDTGKAEIKAESEAALVEIAKLMTQRPALRVFVVGHTDMVGDPAANLKLSLARAQSVVSALTGKYGVAAARLMPYGNGPYSPVASNKNEGGRGKNRRVELVDAATQ